jgi:hypothetical protein
MPDYQLALSILGLLVMVYGVHHQRKQTKLMESQTLSRPARRRGETPGLIWWKSPAIWTLFALMCLTWGPYLLSKSGEEQTIRDYAAGIRAGAINNNTGKPVDITFYVAVDGNEVYKYFPWRAMAVAFVWPTDRDLDDVQDLQKSPAYEIRKAKMEFWFKSDNNIIDQLNKGAPVNYAIILLPRNVTATAFATLRQAKDLGAKIIEIGSWAHH